MKIPSKIAALACVVGLGVLVIVCLRGGFNNYADEAPLADTKKEKSARREVSKRAMRKTPELKEHSLIRDFALIIKPVMDDWESNEAIWDENNWLAKEPSCRELLNKMGPLALDAYRKSVNNKKLEESNQDLWAAMIVTSLLETFIAGNGRFKEIQKKHPELYRPDRVLYTRREIQEIIRDQRFSSLDPQKISLTNAMVQVYKKSEKLDLKSKKNFLMRKELYESVGGVYAK